MYSIARCMQLARVLAPAAPSRMRIRKAQYTSPCHDLSVASTLARAKTRMCARRRVRLHADCGITYFTRVVELVLRSARARYRLWMAYARASSNYLLSTWGVERQSSACVLRLLHTNHVERLHAASLCPNTRKASVACEAPQTTWSASY